MENIVSIWIGITNSESKLNEYVKEKYTEEGEMKSSFMEDFKIDFYDENFRECLFSKDKISINQFSYSESFIEKINKIEMENCNSFILLYNFTYDKSVLKNKNFKFIGCFDYIE